MKLGIYGIRVDVACWRPELAENIGRDFSYFRRTDGGKPDITLEFRAAPPEFSLPPDKRPLWKTGDYAVYDVPGKRLVDYNGEALAEYDFRNEKGCISSLNSALLHELAYLLILSRAGEFLDARGLHRVHALGFKHAQTGALLLLPSGGGKTTLWLELMDSADCSILSDDTPLADRSGTVYPFPLRLGVCSGDSRVKKFSPSLLRPFLRRRFPPKTLVDIEGCGGKIASPASSGYIFIGRTRRGGRAAIEKAAPFLLAWRLFTCLVIGKGVPQIIEYLLRPALTDLARKAGYALSRSRAALSLARRWPAYEFNMSGDLRADCESLDNFLRVKAGEGSPRRRSASAAPLSN